MAGKSSREPGSAGDWEAEYAAEGKLYNRLLSEVLFSLKEQLASEGITTHSVTGRVKTIESLREKVERKGYEDPLEQAEDLVGVRVVTLFLSDLPRVRATLGHLFNVLTEEDRLEGEDDTSFGYMSLHYIAKSRTSIQGLAMAAIAVSNRPSHCT